MVDQDATHHLCGDAEEVCAILPGRPLLTEQPQIRFMDKCRGLQGVVGALSSKIRASPPPKLTIDEWHQLITGFEVACRATSRLDELPPSSDDEEEGWD